MKHEEMRINLSGNTDQTQTSLRDDNIRLGQEAIWDETSPRIMLEDGIKRDALSSRGVAAYAVGHFNNDLCAAAWFTYVLYYVKEVVGLSSVVSGFVILSG